MALETEQLLLSNRVGDLSLDRFCAFFVDDYLPADLYEALRRTYPAGTEYRTNAEHKRGLRSSEDPDEVERFCGENPQWAELFEFFRSDEFIDDARRTLAQPLADSRPGWPGRRPWYNANTRPVPRNWLRYQVQEPVVTTFQFSQLPRGAFVAPHSDAPRKLISMLLYFREPEWQEEWGGDTEYYAPLDSKQAEGWAATDRMAFEEFKTIGRTGFVANRLAGFVRAANSFHGVRPLSCPDDLARKAFMINVKRVKWSKRNQL